MTTLREQIAAKVVPLLNPITGLEPAGSDPSLDAEFERIKAEVEKLSSIDGRQPAWPDVRELGSALLSKRAKDLRVAGWLGMALLRLDGWSGLAEGLFTYESLARSFWDRMYPDARRARGRVSAFSWFSEVAAKHLKHVSVTFSDGDAIRMCQEVLQVLDALFAEKFGEAYPGPGPLGALLREKVLAIPSAPIDKATSTPPAAAAGVPETSPAGILVVDASAQAPAAFAATSVGDADAAIRENAQALIRAGAALRTAEPTRPLAYRLTRSGAWLTVDDPPPSEGGRTRIRPPPDGLVRRLATLRDGQKWLELLNAAEDSAGSYVFWMDLHRSAAVAMDRLGPTFSAAREVVGREVAAFIARVPAVASLAFSNGTPFADAGTTTWLEEEARRWGRGSGISAASAAVSAEEEEVAKRFAEAEALVNGGHIAEGLGAAVALAARGADGRTRFRASLAVGKMALGGSKPEVARAILDRLASYVERHDLEGWEPALCATLYSNLLRATRESMRAKSSPADLASKEQSLFEKLCRLDPAVALRLGGG